MRPIAPRKPSPPEEAQLPIGENDLLSYTVSEVMYKNAIASGPVPNRYRLCKQRIWNNCWCSHTINRCLCIPARHNHFGIAPMAVKQARYQFRIIVRSEEHTSEL